MSGIRRGRECNSRAIGRVNGDDLWSSRKAGWGGAGSEAGVGVDRKRAAPAALAKATRLWTRRDFKRKSPVKWIVQRRRAETKLQRTAASLFSPSL